MDAIALYLMLGDAGAETAVNSQKQPYIINGQAIEVDYFALNEFVQSNKAVMSMGGLQAAKRKLLWYALLNSSGTCRKLNKIIKDYEVCHPDEVLSVEAPKALKKKSQDQEF